MTRTLNQYEDRCDSSTTTIDSREKHIQTSCAAQAYVVVEKDGLELNFCRHHFIKNEDQLLLQGFSATVDERHTIENVNKLQGAHTG
jgi:hypothetical protein